jgi:two-component system, sensor histidine kinase and response regulator
MMPTLNILLALHEEEIRTLASQQLTRAGHRVVAVADGREAIKAAQQVRFDVVLLDEQMSITSGIDAARAFRQLASDSNPVPLLVAVTENATKQDRDRLRAAGFAEVLSKPFRVEALNEILPGLPARMMDVTAPDAPDGRDENPIEVLSRRVNGDQNLMRKLIASFLRDLPSRMSSLKLALQRGDAVEVGALAHALKGSVSIFGASQALTRSEELQNLGRKGDLEPAHRLLKSLQDDIAQLERKLRGYAQPAKVARRTKARKRARPRGTQRKRK